MDEKEFLKDIEEAEKDLDKEVKQSSYLPKLTIGILLGLLIILMAIPYRSISTDFEPRHIPTREDVLKRGLSTTCWCLTILMSSKWLQK